jgi:hypothetical protein
MYNILKDLIMYNIVDIYLISILEMSNLWHGFASPILNVLEYLEATFIHICPKKKKILMELPHVDMVWRKQTRLVGERPHSRYYIKKSSTEA